MLTGVGQDALYSQPLLFATERPKFLACEGVQASPVYGLIQNVIQCLCVGSVSPSPAYKVTRNPCPPPPSSQGVTLSLLLRAQDADMMACLMSCPGRPSDEVGHTSMRT